MAQNMEGDKTKKLERKRGETKSKTGERFEITGRTLLYTASNYSEELDKKALQLKLGSHMKWRNYGQNRSRCPKTERWIFRTSVIMVYYCMIAYTKYATASLTQIRADYFHVHVTWLRIADPILDNGGIRITQRKKICKAPKRNGIYTIDLWHRNVFLSHETCLSPEITTVAHVWHCCVSVTRAPALTWEENTVACLYGFWLDNCLKPPIQSRRGTLYVAFFVLVIDTSGSVPLSET